MGFFAFLFFQHSLVYDSFCSLLLGTLLGMSNQISFQEQLEHAEVSTALRYLGQYYFKNKLYDEASLCAQRCCDYNDVSVLASSDHHLVLDTWLI